MEKDDIKQKQMDMPKDPAKEEWTWIILRWKDEDDMKQKQMDISKSARKKEMDHSKMEGMKGRHCKKKL
jgi:hypothetical protein